MPKQPSLVKYKYQKKKERRKVHHKRLKVLDTATATKMLQINIKHVCIADLKEPRSDIKLSAKVV
jgi:hypothetical protein